MNPNTLNPGIPVAMTSVNQCLARCLATALIVMPLLLCPLVAGAEVEPVGLPDYRPELQVSSILRSRGNDQMATLMKAWQEGFRKYHPDVQFADSLKGSASGMYGLDMRTADMALMGRPVNPYERYGIYERSWVYPVEIEVATGAAAQPHKSPAYAILVHRDNPLARITLEQLDGVFGAQRQGGWKKLSWDVNAARGADRNIRNWGQLGLNGPLADQPIHVYGPPLLGAGAITWFQSRVLQGGSMWNEDLREYADRKAMVTALANDPLGIAYTALGYANAGVKPLAVADKASGPFIELNANTVVDRSYPLARPVYIVYAIDDEHAEFTDPRGDPGVREFLRYVLSRQGQADVGREGTYLPLTPEIAREQLLKVDAHGISPERALLSE
jgi:phosphate transport system substrate-binding protein